MIKVYTLLVALSLTNFKARAQTNINDEVFKYFFLPVAEGANLVYVGKSHTITLKVNGQHIRKDNKISNKANQNFIKIDDELLETSWVPLPHPIPKSWILGNLTESQQKDALDGYVNYEMNYFDGFLFIKENSFKSEWKFINSKLFLIWSFEFKPKYGAKSEGYNTQIFYATVCFNQIIDINVPFENKDNFTVANQLAESIASSLRTYNSRMDIKKQIN